MIHTMGGRRARGWGFSCIRNALFKKEGVKEKYYMGICLDFSRFEILHSEKN